MKNIEPKGSSLPPLSLYVHIPWCVKKCPYCDFNSHASKGELPISQYVDALIQDLVLDSAYAQGRKLQSIFFGGGTPSLFPGDAIGEIISAAKSLLGFVDDIEITLEANPGATEHHTFEDLLKAGVNRLSVGVQSFNNLHLQQLGRIHSSNEATTAIQAAQNAGFGNINIDLMHGLPGQTSDEALNDLAKATELNTTHLSWYQLTIEPNTEFYSRPPQLPRENTLWQIHKKGLDFLAANSFERYEVSAFSKPGKEARHNLNYWQFGDYIGIGAGAHGKISGDSRRFRTAKKRQPNDYLEPALGNGKEFTVINQTIDEQNLIIDFMLNALRLSKGVERQTFCKHTGLDYHFIASGVQDLQKRGLLVSDEQSIIATPKGFDFLDTILQEFMPN